MILEKYDHTKEGIDKPSSRTLRCRHRRGTWAGVMVVIIVISHERSGRTHTFREGRLYSTPRSVAILLGKQECLDYYWSRMLWG